MAELLVMLSFLEVVYSGGIHRLFSRSLTVREEGYHGKLSNSILSVVNFFANIWSRDGE